MELTEQDIAAIHETHDAVVKLNTLIVGNGTPGLCDRVKSLEADHAQTKGRLYTLIGVLVGSGAISGSVIGIQSLLK